MSKKILYVTLFLALMSFVCNEIIRVAIASEL